MAWPGLAPLNLAKSGPVQGRRVGCTASLAPGDNSHDSAPQSSSFFSSSSSSSSSSSAGAAASFFCRRRRGSSSRTYGRPAAAAAQPAEQGGPCSPPGPPQNRERLKRTPACRGGWRQLEQNTPKGTTGRLASLARQATLMHAGPTAVPPRPQRGPMGAAALKFLTSGAGVVRLESTNLMRSAFSRPPLKGSTAAGAAGGSPGCSRPSLSHITSRKAL